jgi:hypothetical protein
MLIFFKYCNEDYLNQFYNDRNPLDAFFKEVSDQKQKFHSWQQRFFPDTEFKDNEIWDQREQLALILRPDMTVNWMDTINLSKPHLNYDTYDAWNFLPEVMAEIIAQSGFTMQIEKVETWKQIYHKWRDRHDPAFSRHYDKILEAIVNNHYLCLKRFKLDFFKEALIQHGLIKKHNLNLKTWQLSTFPDNTQDLYALLEPNIHDI